MSRVNHDSEAQNAYFHLHLVAPKLFPAWGTRPAGPVSPKWALLDSKSGWTALPAAIHLVHAVGLEWGYDSECHTITVQDGVNEVQVDTEIDVRVSLMAALRLMIVRRPELTDPDTWASYATPPRPQPSAPALSVTLPDADVLNAWNNLRAIAPKLFPAWGAEGKDTPLSWLNWQELGNCDPQRAAAEVFAILCRLRLGWAWDTKHGEVTVQDTQCAYGYHGSLPQHADVRVALLDGLADLLTDWPELGDPDLWANGEPPRRPRLSWTSEGQMMDGKLVLPAEPPRDDTAWNAAVAECNASIKTAVQKLSEVK